MENKEKTITFKADEQTIDSFKLSLNILGLDSEKAFEERVKELTNKALRKNNGEPEPQKAVELNKRSYLSGTIDNEIVRARIQRWARKKDGFAYKMLKTFFELYDSNDEHEVKRIKMKNRYTELYLQDKTSTTIDLFIITFRQMCSDAARAYGPIFKYININGEDQVVLHPLNRDFILSLKKEF